MKTTVGVIWLFAVALAVPAAAQVPTKPRHIGEARYEYPQGGESPVAILSRLLKDGDWRRLQHYGQELIATLGGNTATRDLLGDTRRNYYNLIWTDAGDDGKPAVRRVMVHAGLEPQHATQLPGLTATWPDDPGTVVASPPANRPLTGTPI